MLTLLSHLAKITMKESFPPLAMKSSRLSSHSSTQQSSSLNERRCHNESGPILCVERQNLISLSKTFPSPT